MHDQAALQPLLDVMAAAGRHDRDAVDARIDEVLAILAPRPRHKARPDALAAREAAAAGEWVRCWTKAHHAICGLTYVFPPDQSTCPPRPGSEPFTEGRDCACGETLPMAARFCPTCGQPA